MALAIMTETPSTVKEVISTSFPVHHTNTINAFFAFCHSESSCVPDISNEYVNNIIIIIIIILISITGKTAHSEP
jgi:hypothetical protein